jgi:hypothetical protein
MIKCLNFFVYKNGIIVNNTFGFYNQLQTNFFQLFLIIYKEEKLVRIYLIHILPYKRYLYQIQQLL